MEESRRNFLEHIFEDLRKSQKVAETTAVDIQVAATTTVDIQVAATTAANL